MPSDPARVPPLPVEHLLEVYEVAYTLKCSHEHVRRLIRTGQLSAVRFGQRGWRIHPADLETYLNAQRVVADLFAGHQGRMGQSDRRATPRAPDGPRRMPKTKGA